MNSLIKNLKSLVSNKCQSSIVEQNIARLLEKKISLRTKLSKSPFYLFLLARISIFKKQHSVAFDYLNQSLSIYELNQKLIQNVHTVCTNQQNFTKQLEITNQQYKHLKNVLNYMILGCRLLLSQAIFTKTNKIWSRLSTTILRPQKTAKQGSVLEEQQHARINLETLRNHSTTIGKASNTISLILIPLKIWETQSSSKETFKKLNIFTASHTIRKIVKV